MDVAHIKLFRDIASTRSVSRGAAMNGISQSAASQHLQELERPKLRLAFAVGLAASAAFAMIFTKPFFDSAYKALECPPGMLAAAPTSVSPWNIGQPHADLLRKSEGSGSNAHAHAAAPFSR